MRSLRSGFICICKRRLDRVFAAFLEHLVVNVHFCFEELLIRRDVLLIDGVEAELRESSLRAKQELHERFRLSSNARDNSMCVSAITMPES